MKIIILGAGRVGRSVAENLVGEANDITVIDSNPDALHSLDEHYDLRTIYGFASHPSVLEEAGARDADMIIALTNSDEINMMACQVAYTLFHVPTKIARIRHREYLGKETVLFSQEALPIDVLISPEQIITQYIHRLISYPGALQVLDFANGTVQMIGIRVYPGSLLDGIYIAALSAIRPDIEFRIMMIFRAGSPVVPVGKTILQENDKVYLIVASKHVRELLSVISRDEQRARNIIIAGGGNIGTLLSKELEAEHISVKLIEIDKEQAKSASTHLKNTVVLHGDAADNELLLDEGIEETDAFCALTSADEANILSAMLAKNLGAKKVISLINRPTYVELVQSGSIDIAISPQLITIGRLLAHVRRGDVVEVHSLRKGLAEAIEAIAHGDYRSSKVVGRTVCEINLPPDTTIGAIVRNGEMLIAHHDSVIEAEDHVILLVSHKKYVPHIERLFQVGVTFL